MQREHSTTSDAPLTPRQDRIEAAIERILRSGGTRSELRDQVHEYADLARLLDVPSQHALARLEQVARRAFSLMIPTNEAAVGDSAADRLAMMMQWCAARYSRAD